MFDVSLSELLIIFFASILLLKPKDVLSIINKLKKLKEQSLSEDNFLALKKINMIKGPKTDFKNDKKEKRT